ncbi:uncharacterized protein [Cardiocondyla obscurior]|uniref:uncharacterized protein n=1 Tax=Cardiocondyla obscurior TaxID=286306 RepID=UPI0039657B90
MFRQIKIHQDDRDFLRILWSPNESEAPMEYRHTTTYVDDIFGGADCLYEAQRERKELISLLKTAGIELDKWAANHNSLLPENLKRQEISNTEIPKETFETVKTLGIQWDPFLDAFGFSVKTQGISINIFTKRNILFCLSKLYDPLGWISPVIIAGKIFIQDLWIAGVGWDEKLDFNKQQFWKGFQNSLQDLNNLKINRWFETSPKSKMELHGFCDASTRAYAAAIYIRTVSEEGKINVSLVASKAKVSPVKTVSIPKLELCRAALLVRLFNHVRKLNFLKDLDVIAWSDSQVTLAWIKKHPSQWKTFIANRVSFIQTQLPEASWKYIPTKQNPADMASRGLSSSELRDSSLWWHGPLCLSQFQDFSSKQEEEQVLTDADSQILSSFAIATEQGQEEDEIITRFSSLLRATRIRRNPGRGHSANKGYIALFICLATKAVHIEAVGDLSTEAFLGAYRRFAGRRGVCRILYSDNGTNFKGADVELRKMFEESSEFFGNTAEKLASQGTEWKFIPPRTPHFGGIWEAGIKSMKRHLIKVMGDHKLTFEELSTVLVQIEACMNTRPLCPLSNDPEDLDVLTPAHFLTGEVSTLIPEAELTDIPENRLNRYQLLQKIRESENLREGQLVILREEGLPPAKWSMGRILKIHPGADGLVRVVTLKTSTTVLKRSITRIIPILQEEEKDKEERSSNEQRKDK